MNKNPYYILLLFLICYSTANANKIFHPHNDIYAVVQQYLDENLNATHGVKIKTEMGHLDPRLRLSPCSQTLKSFSNNHQDFGSKISVGVKCEGKKPWSLYVPVKIQRFATVLVANQPIAKGDKITERDIQAISRDINQLRGNYYKLSKDIVGKISKRRIALGSVFNPRYLRLPIIVKKGDMVDIIAETSGLQIRMAGKAISNGAKGETISVKNISSKRIIQAIVQHPGLVKIKL